LTTRRHIPCLLGVALLVAAGLTSCGPVSQGQEQELLEQWRAARGTQKLELARDMIKRSPQSPLAHLVLAETLVILEEPQQAIDLIDRFEFKDRADRARGLGLRVRAGVDRVHDLIDRMGDALDDTLDEQVQQTLDGTEDARLELASLPDQNQDALLWQARIVDAEHRWRVHRQGAHREVAHQARRIDHLDTAEKHEAIVARLGERLDLLGRRLRRITDELILIDPRGSEGYTIWFEACMRRGDQAAARELCQRLARAKAPDPALVFELAYHLIRRDDLREVDGTTPNLRLAERLLALVPEGTGPALRESRARAWYAMRQRDFEAAGRHARVMLDEFPQHPDAMGMLGLIKAHRGETYEAAQMIGRLVQRERSATAYELLGDAHTAMGDHRQAREAYRSALDEDRDRFTARLKLVRSLADQGLVEEASWDLDVLKQLDERHPLVVRYATYHDVAVVNRAALLQRIDDVFAVETMRWSDAAAAVAMVLNDEALLSSLEALPESQRLTPGFADVVRGWTLSDPGARVGSAMVVLEAIIPRVNNQPLRETMPPPVRSMQRWLDGQVGVDRKPGLAGRRAHPWRAPARPQLLVANYLPWGEELALQLTRFAQHRWPDRAEWWALQSRLCYWLGDEAMAAEQFDQLAVVVASQGLSDTAAVAARDLPDVLGVDAPWLTDDAGKTRTSAKNGTALLHLAQVRRAARAHDVPACRLALELLRRERPDDMLAPLWMMHHLRERGDTELSKDFMAYLEAEHYPASLMARARLAWLDGDTIQARNLARMLMSHQAERWHMRRLAADVNIGAALDEDASDAAMRTLESVALRRDDQSRLDQHVLVDVMIEAGRHSLVRYLIHQAPVEGRCSPHQRDAIIARAAALLTTPELLEAVRAYQAAWPDDPLLKVWEAEARLRLGELDRTRSLLEATWRDHPEASRSGLQLAEVYARMGMEREALALFDMLQQRQPWSHQEVIEARQRWLPDAEPSRQAAGGM